MKHIIVCMLALLGLSTVASAQAPAPSLRSEILPGPIQGEVLQVLDGDTVTVRLHVWIGQSLDTHVRIAGIDTPEMRSKCAAERAKAKQARDEISKLLSDNRIQLTNVRLEKYAGRVLAEAYAADGTSIRSHMISKGLARPYGGERREEWC